MTVTAAPLTAPRWHRSALTIGIAVVTFAGVPAIWLPFAATSRGQRVVQPRFMSLRSCVALPAGDPNRGSAGEVDGQRTALERRALVRAPPGRGRRLRDRFDLGGVLSAASWPERRRLDRLPRAARHARRRGRFGLWAPRSGRRPADWTHRHDGTGLLPTSCCACWSPGSMESFRSARMPCS